MKFNIVAISPMGATLSFFNVEHFCICKQEGGAVYAVFEKKKATHPIGLIPLSWAINRKPAEEMKNDFKPLLIPMTGKP